MCGVEEIPDVHGVFALAGTVGTGGWGAPAIPGPRTPHFPQVHRGKPQLQPCLQTPEGCLVGSRQSHRLFLSSAIQLPYVIIKSLPACSTLAECLTRLQQICKESRSRRTRLCQPIAQQPQTTPKAHAVHSFLLWLIKETS